MTTYDARADAFLEHTQLTDNFMKSLFGVLYQMYDLLVSILNLLFNYMYLFISIV